jgi:hypothetical protein
MIRFLLAAIALLAIAAPAASAHDAEIFATNNTATITDPADPRLDKTLDGFARRVEDIIRDGGARPRGSELLDGVFCCELTFERSRRFDVDRADDAEVHDIAETIRRRFLQGSVLTFIPRAGGDAVELDVPKVSAKALQDGLVADPEAQQRLFGGSVTQDRHLLLVADGADADFARAFAKKIGGDVKHATVRTGIREFVSAATDGRARIEKRTLVIAGTAGDDVIALRDSGRRLAIDFGDDGVVDFEPSFRRFDRIRFDGGDGHDTVVSHGKQVDLVADAFAGIERIDLDDPDRVSVQDLSQTGVQEVYVNLGDGVDRVSVDGSDDRDNILVGGFADTVYVLGPTFVQINHAERFDRLRVNGRDGRDDMSASTDAMKLTLDGGDDGGTLFGGPGDDMLIGGDGFDDVTGGKGNDRVYMRGYFDRFSWKPGEGTDSVDGGGSHDSLFFQGINNTEVFDFFRDRHDVRLVHDPGAEAVDMHSVEEIDGIAFGGEDLFDVRDLSGTGVDLIDLSLAPSFGTADGDNLADRVDVDADAPVKVTGQKLFSGAVTMTGLTYTVKISHSDGLLDTLAIHGAPSVDTSGLQAGTIGVQGD